MLKPQRVFVLTASIFGFLFLFVTPPFQAPDEFNHFSRAFQVSEGNFVSERFEQRSGGFLPESIRETMAPYHGMAFHPNAKHRMEDVGAAWNLPLDADRRIFVDFPNTALYSPVPYLPQSLGFSVGRVLDASPLILLYLGRLSNLLVWIVCVYFAVRLTPISKWVFVLLALTPMSLFQAASLSADSLTNALAFLTAAFFLQCALDEARRVGIAEIGILAVLTVSLSLSKSAYFPVVLLFFMMPASKIGSRPRYFAYFMAIGLLNASVLVGWSMVIDQLYISYDAYDPAYRASQPLVKGVAPYLQLDLMLSDPVRFFGVVIRSFWMNLEFVCRSFIGVLGWTDAPLPRPAAFLGMSSLLFFAVFDSSRARALGARERSVLLLAAAAMILVFCAFMYMSWVPAGGDRIMNLQGRYFIPVAPLIFVMMNSRTASLEQRYLDWMASGHLVLILTLGVVVLLQRYYLQ